MVILAAGYNLTIYKENIMFMTKEEIIFRVRKIEEKKDFVERCVGVKVCPGCGDDLIIMDDEIIINYRCKNCNFNTITTNIIKSV